LQASRRRGSPSSISPPGAETTESLSALVAEKAADLLVEALTRIEEGTAEPEPQNQDEATYCKLIRKEDGEIDWAREAERIERMVRAYTPWPGAYTYWGDRKLTVREAAVYTADALGPTPDRPAADAAAEPGDPTVEGAAARPDAVSAAADSYEAGEEALATHEEPGHVLGVDRRWGILIQTGSGVLAVQRLQLQAGQTVDWKSFINGHQDFPGTVLGG
jgi:methionyl-tRNA formyltransferase